MEAINFEDYIQRQEAYAAKMQAEQGEQREKYEELGIKHASISYLTEYLDNPMIWFIKRIMKVKSRFPMYSAYRGKAVEAATSMAILTRDSDQKIDFQDMARKHYQLQVIQSVYRNYPENLLPIGNGKFFDIEKESIKFANCDRETFTQRMFLMIEALWKKIPEDEKANYPEFIDPTHKEHEKFKTKVLAEYDMLELLDDSIKYFSQFDEQILMQKRIEQICYGLTIPMIGYTDYEIKDVGFDQKTKKRSMFPESVEEFREDKQGKWFNEKRQIAFYSKTRKKPFRLVMFSPVSKSYLELKAKYDLILSLAKQGVKPFLSEEEKAANKKAKLKVDTIKDVYKDMTGKGTTDKFVEKVLFGAPLEEQKTMIELELTPEEVEQYDKWNYVAAQSIDRIIKGLQSGNAIEDLKYLCVSTPNGKYGKPDPDMCRAIKDIYGLDVTPDDDEEEKEGENFAQAE